MLREFPSLEGLEGLKDLVKRSCEPTGVSPTALPGLTLLHMERADPLAAVNEPAVPELGLCVVVQGCKYVTMGNRRYTYEPQNYSVTTVNLPTADIQFDPTQETPFLALRLALDPALLSELLLDAPPDQEQPHRASSTVFSPLVPELTSALYRLVHSLQDPHDMAVLAPQIKREITYRLLRGPQRSVLRLIVNSDSSLSQIKRAIGWIRSNFAATFRIEDVAAIACMSTSSFHQHFKRITSMSPLQYQKQLRLHEARRMLVERGADAQTVAFEVGYDSASQFSREYKRLFGAPPMKDISLLRRASHA